MLVLQQRYRHLTNRHYKLVLQESCSDFIGSYVIYTPIDVVFMNVILGGEGLDYVSLLSLSYAILPDGLNSLEDEILKLDVGVH